MTKEKDKTTREKDEVRDAIYAQRDQFIRLAHEIHTHPQLAFAEEYAASRITEFLFNEGFDVRTGVYGMPTAFVATIGSGPLHVAFCAEYNALPSSVLTDRTPKDFVGLVPPPKPVDPHGPSLADPLWRDHPVTGRLASAGSVLQCWYRRTPLGPSRDATS